MNETTRTLLETTENVREKHEARKASRERHPANEILAGMLRTSAIMEMLERENLRNLRALLHLATFPEFGYTSNGDLEFILDSLERVINEQT